MILKELIEQKSTLKKQIEKIRENEYKNEQTKAKIKQVYETLTHPISDEEFDKLLKSDILQVNDNQQLLLEAELKVFSTESLSLINKYKDEIAVISAKINEMLENLPKVTVKEFNEMIKSIFISNYNIEAESTILNRAYLNGDKKRTVDLILILKRCNSSDAVDTYKLASETIPSNKISSNSSFVIKLGMFLLKTIKSAESTNDWTDLTKKYPEFEDVIYQVIAQVKTAELTSKKSIISHMIEKKNEELKASENLENLQPESFSEFLTQVELIEDIKQREQDLSDLESKMSDWEF